MRRHQRRQRRLRAALHPQHRNALGRTHPFMAVSCPVGRAQGGHVQRHSAQSVRAVHQSGHAAGAAQRAQCGDREVDRQRRDDLVNDGEPDAAAACSERRSRAGRVALKQHALVGMVGRNAGQAPQCDSGPGLPAKLASCPAAAPHLLPALPQTEPAPAGPPSPHPPTHQQCAPVAGRHALDGLCIG